MYDLKKPAAFWSDAEVRAYYRAALDEAERMAGHRVRALEDVAGELEPDRRP